VRKGFNSGRFVDQEQWERWRAKRKLVSGSKHRAGGKALGVGAARPAERPGYITSAKNVEIVWPENDSRFRSIVTNTLTM